jgi:hypothetical protein
MDSLGAAALIIVSYLVGRALVDASFASTINYCLEAAVR